MNQNDTPPVLEIIPHDSSLQLQPSAVSEPKPARSGCRLVAAGMIGCAALLLIIPLALVLLGVTSMNSLIGSFGSLLGAGNPPRASVISTQTIVEGIQPMGQLVSVSVQLAKADVRVNINQGALNSGGYGASHVIQGTIEAGIDLTQIGTDDLNYDPLKQTYTLTVPEPELTSCRIDYIRQYDQSFTTLGVDWDEARLMANYMGLTELRDDAIEGGILTRAQTETRTVLGNFVSLVTGHAVLIVFQQPEATEEPPSCQPDPPAGWSYSPDANVWFK